MSRKKLIRINAARDLPNVFACEDIASQLDGKAVVFELGCGDGLFAVEFARRNPDLFVVGVDVKLDRLYKAGCLAIELGVENCVFVRMRAEDLLRFVPEGSLQQLWLTFSDPQPKKGSAKKRLTHTRFLKVYNQLLSKDGRVCFKSDSDSLYNFTLEQLSELKIVPTLDVLDTHSQLSKDSPYLIETVFEKKFREKGIKIKALEWNSVIL